MLFQGTATSPLKGSYHKLLTCGERISYTPPTAQVTLMTIGIGTFGRKTEQLSESVLGIKVLSNEENTLQELGLGA